MTLTHSWAEVVAREFEIRESRWEDPLEIAKEVDSGFVPRAHLQHLSHQVRDAVERVEQGQSQQIVVEMPPRMGKSTLLSLHTPLWILRRHPEWKILTASYDGTLMGGWARSVRNTIEDRPDLGIQMARDGGAGTSWQTREGGGIHSTSVRGPLTGRGAKVMLIDDPVKDFADAHSMTMRQGLWDWWLSTAQTRLEAPSLVIVVMCMTGDTPVLRPDGSETPLRDIRPGDEIATYEDGGLSTSRVMNWANQGPDDVFAIRLESGRVVRANARHPFLTVDERGVETWRRTDQLTPGESILTATGGSGAASNAAQKAATGQSAARASARRTTTRPAGLKVIDPRRATLSLAELRGSSTATASQRKSTTLWLPTSEDSARSAERLQKRTAPHIGQGSSASTTTTGADRYEDSSATAATSSSGSTTRPSDSGQQLTTWNVTPDRVVSIEPAGREDVFDLQVERTENFIANGLVSHNTRWHEDDFVGRLLSREYEGDPDTWQEISFPAIAEDHDALGRQAGDPLYSPLLNETRAQALDRWDKLRTGVGSYSWASLYQQRPAPAQGAIFDTGWWRYWTRDPDKAREDGTIVHLDPATDLTGARWVDSWDAAFKATDSSDYVVGQRWARQGPDRYLIAQQRDRMSFTQTIERMRAWAPDRPSAMNPQGHLVHERLIEDAANGPAIIDTLREEIAGIKPVSPKTSKEARARAITPEVESGNVYLPHPSDPGNEWVQDLLSELRNFPHDVHDDQVDALTQALSNLRDMGRGSITVPGRRRTPARNVVRAAQSIRPARTSPVTAPSRRR